MRKLRRNQSGIIYILATIVVFLFFIGFVWFTLWAIMTPIGEAMAPLASSYHNASWPLYDTLEYAEGFMSSFWLYLLALAFFGLTLWTYQYSQHRGQPY